MRSVVKVFHAIAVIMCLLFCDRTWAATFLVSKNSRCSNTVGAPCYSTLEYATKNASNGDTIQLAYDNGVPYVDDFIWITKKRDIQVVGVPGPEGQSPVIGGRCHTNNATRICPLQLVATQSPYVAFIKDSQDITIAGIEIRNEGRPIIVTNNVHGLHIRDMHIHHVSKEAVKIQGGSDVWIVNNTFEHTSLRVQTTATETSSGGEPFWIRGVGKKIGELPAFIINNIFRHNRRVASIFTHESKVVVASNQYANNCGMNIYLVGAMDSIAFNNVISNTDQIADPITGVQQSCDVMYPNGSNSGMAINITIGDIGTVPTLADCRSERISIVHNSSYRTGGYGFWDACARHGIQGHMSDFIVANNTQDFTTRRLAAFKIDTATLHNLVAVNNSVSNSERGWNFKRGGALGNAKVIMNNNYWKVKRLESLRGALGPQQDPQLRDPVNLDFRLRTTSPLHKAAIGPLELYGLGLYYPLNIGSK